MDKKNHWVKKKIFLSVKESLMVCVKKKSLTEEEPYCEAPMLLNPEIATDGKTGQLVSRSC